MQEETTRIYRQYDAGVNYKRSKGLYTTIDKCWRFYLGDQWHGLKVEDMPTPILNIIRSIVNIKISTIAQKNLSVVYSSPKMSDAFGPVASKFADAITQHAAQLWERRKMDTRLWLYLLDGAVTGNAVCYAYYNPETKENALEKLNAANYYPGDVNDSDVQSQPYIILSFRRNVDDVRQEARTNGIPKDEIDLIVGDDETQEQAGDDAKKEINTTTGADEQSAKCLCLLKLWKQDGTVWMSKATRTVEYFKAADTGMTLYPVALYSWLEQPGNAFGRGEVQDLIQNQISINKMLARREISTMHTAFPTLVYDSMAVPNMPDKMGVGGRIAMENTQGQNIRQIIDYLTPGQMSPDAKAVLEELLTYTRDYAGAGDAAIGNVDPEKASGRAILAVQDAAARPLNIQMQALYQFIEDLAAIDMDMWTAYGQEQGKIFTAKDESGQAVDIEISPEQLQALKLDIKIDVSPATPFSLLAQEQSLENLLVGEYITFGEYVELLPDSSVIPKARLKELLTKRAQMEQEQAEMQEQNQIDGFINQIKTLPPEQALMAIEQLPADGETKQKLIQLVQNQEELDAMSQMQ